MTEKAWVSCDIKAIKTRLEEESERYTPTLEQYFPHIQGREFMVNVIRKYIKGRGKRLRPVLFVLSYQGYEKNSFNPSIYRGALGMELMHLFALIHDDIIDRTDERRGAPSLYKMFENHLQKQKCDNARGDDFAMVAGDIIYSLGLESFMSMDFQSDLKSGAMQYLLQTAVRTGGGEIMELYSSGRDIDLMQRQEISEVYDFKSSWYTFICPLVLGAMLGGAGQKELDLLGKYGKYMGYAFQMKDDLLDLQDKYETKGRKSFDDIRGRKRTLLLWYAFQNASEPDRKTLDQIFSSPEISDQQCLAVRDIYIKTGTFEFAENEIQTSMDNVQKLFSSLSMDKETKKVLRDFCECLLSMEECD